MTFKVVLSKTVSAFFRFYFKLRYGKRVQFGQNVILNHRFCLKGPGRLIIGDSVNLWAHEEPNRFFFYDSKAVIKIGSGTRLNGITCHSASSIHIGEKCLIGSATLIDTDFHTFNDPQHILFGKPLTKPIKIGQGVWLCGQTAILKGVEIGDHAVVGFRAVVTKSFPGHCVIAGNPAQIVKEKAKS